MTNKLLIGIQAVLGGAVVALLLLAAGVAQASEVTGTLTSGATSNTVSGTVVGTIGTGSTATGTITGGTGSTISGTVVSPDGTGGGGDSSSGGGSSRRSGGGSSNNDNGEVLGAQTPDGVGGGFGTPGIPDTGSGAEGLEYLLALLLAMLGAAAAYAGRARLS